MRGWRRKLRFRAEVRLVRLGMALIPRLPRPALRRLADLGGRAACWLAPGTRRLAAANIKLALGDTIPAAARRRLVRRAFRNMALVMLDFFWFSRDTAARLERHVQVDDWMRACLRHGPVIGVTAHFGNWELLAQAFAMDGVSVTAVVAPLANPAVDERFRRFRRDGGVTIIPRRGAIRGLLRTLHAGGNVALLLDQNVKPEDGGVFVDFFGLPIPMSTAAAVLAERTGAAIMIVFCRLDDAGNYRLYTLPPWCVARGADTDVNVLRHEVTQTVARAFEREIRSWPAQWLWMYKRWKHVAPGASRAQYPYYAK